MSRGNDIDGRSTVINQRECRSKMSLWQPQAPEHLQRCSLARQNVRQGFSVAQGSRPWSFTLLCRKVQAGMSNLAKSCLVYNLPWFPRLAASLPAVDHILKGITNDCLPNHSVTCVSFRKWMQKWLTLQHFSRSFPTFSLNLLF